MLQDSDKSIFFLWYNKIYTFFILFSTLFFQFCENPFFKKKDTVWLQFVTTSFFLLNHFLIRNSSVFNWILFVEKLFFHQILTNFVPMILSIKMDFVYHFFFDESCRTVNLANPPYLGLCVNYFFETMSNLSNFLWCFFGFRFIFWVGVGNDKRFIVFCSVEA